MKTLFFPKASKSIAFVLLVALSCSTRRDDLSSPFQFLTPDVALVLYMHHPETSLTTISKHPVYSAIKSATLTRNVSRDIEMLRLLAGDSSFRYSTEKPLTAGLVLTGARRYGWIFIAHQLPGELVIKKDSTLFTIHTQAYEGEIIYHIQSSVSGEFYIAKSGIHCLISRHKDLIEEALRTGRGTHSLDNVAEFHDVFKTINKKDPVNILINLKEFSDLSNVLLPNLPESWMSFIGRWAALDVDISDPVIRLDGLIQVPDSQGYFLSVLAQNIPAEKKLEHVPIPGFADAFIHINLGNYATFYRKYTEYLDQNNKLIKHTKLWENELKSLPKAAIQEVLKGEFGCFYSSYDNAISKVFYFRTLDAAKASKLMQLSENSAQPLQYRGFKIYELTNPKLLNALYANFPSINERGYYTFIGDFIAVGENESFIYNCINAWEENSLLSRDKEFEKMMSKSGSTGHLIAYSKKSHFQKYLLKHLNKKYPQFSQLIELQGSQIHSLIQLSYLNQNAYVSVVYGSETSDDQSIRQLWTFRTKDLSYGPVKVTNHINQSEEILYQDSKAILHKLSPEGTILWTKQLDDQIIYNSQWDMYKNNRLQHVIVTRRSIYVLDRNGNEVNPWPLRMKGIITAAVLLDYDNTKNYRLLVGEGTTLHNLDIQAKPVKGWQLTRISAPLAFPPTHYTSRSLDYLLFQLQDKSILITDRTGLSRLKTNTYPYKSADPVQLTFPEDGRPWFVTLTKPNGEQINAFQNGKVDSVRILQGAGFGYVRHEGDYLGYTQGNKVIIRDKGIFFEIKVPFQPTDAPLRIHTDRGTVYAVVSAVDQKITLITTSGKIPEGFPIFGVSPPILLRSAVDDRYILITLSGQGHLIAYTVRSDIFEKSG